MLFVSGDVPPKHIKGPVTCKQCGKTYKYQKTLTRHEKYECGDKKPFECIYCSYKTKQKESLKMHIFSKHQTIAQSYMN